MEKHEYEGTKYFQKIKSYEPSERFLKYRLNIVLLSAACLFYLISDFIPTAINFFFMQGTFDKKWAIDLFLGVYLGYNLLMFHFIMKTEVEGFRLIYNFDSYMREVLTHQLSKRLMTLIGYMEVGRSFDISNPDIRVSTTNVNGELKVTVNKRQISSFGVSPESNFESVGLTHDKSGVSYSHKIDDDDKTEYEKQKTFLFNATILNKIDIYIPYFFVTAVIVLYVTKHLLQRAGCNSIL